LTFRTLTRSKQRIFYLVFQNNFLTNTTSDGYPFFTIAGRSV
ncbi:IS256 family transposase, partial [Geobacillus sp. LEMMJ02]